jgi:hypothetical protein
MSRVIGQVGVVFIKKVAVDRAIRVSVRVDHCENLDAGDMAFMGSCRNVDPAPEVSRVLDIQYTFL